MSQSFECPITLNRMVDPVIAADGYTYEHSAIEEHFRKGNSRSPLSNTELSHKILVPNRALKDLIELDNAKNAQIALDKKEKTIFVNVLQHFTSFISDRLNRLHLQIPSWLSDNLKIVLPNNDREDYFIKMADQLSAALRKALPQDIPWKTPSLLKRIELSLTLTMLCCWIMFHPNQLLLACVLAAFNFLECFVTYEYPAICSVENVAAAVALLSALALNGSHSFSSVSRKMLQLILPVITSELGKSNKIFEINKLGGNMVCTCIFLMMNQNLIMADLTLLFLLSSVFGGFLWLCHPGITTPDHPRVEFFAAWVCHLLFAVFAVLSGKIPLMNLTSFVIFSDWAANVVALPCLAIFEKGEKPAWLEFFSVWTKYRPKLFLVLGFKFCFSGGSFSDVVNSFYCAVFTLLPSPEMLLFSLLMSVVVFFFDRDNGSTLLLHWGVLCMKYCVDLLCSKLLLRKTPAYIGNYMAYEPEDPPK